MTDALLLLPDFALIALGWVVCRHTPLGRPVWDGVERLVYYLLFPALLFVSIVRNPLGPETALPLSASGVGITLLGIVAAYAEQSNSPHYSTIKVLEELYVACRQGDRQLRFDAHNFGCRSAAINFSFAVGTNRLNEFAVKDGHHVLRQVHRYSQVGLRYKTSYESA